MTRVGLDWRAMMLVAVTGLLVGCPAAPPPSPPEPCNVQLVTLTLYSDQDVNPEEDGSPRPVVVRLYQLANDLKFSNLTYDEVLDADVEKLGDDLLKTDEIEVFPQDRVTVEFERIPEAATLVGVALFRDPQGQSWRTFYKFPPMPDSVAACQKPGAEAEPDEPQAFPETHFFLKARRIDNGSEFEPSMFADSKDQRKLNLPRRPRQKAPTGP